jgi:hypothetical protein
MLDALERHPGAGARRRGRGCDTAAVDFARMRSARGFASITFPRRQLHYRGGVPLEARASSHPDEGSRLALQLWIDVKDLPDTIPF